MKVHFRVLEVGLIDLYPTNHKTEFHRFDSSTATNKFASKQHKANACVRACVRACVCVRAYVIVLYIACDSCELLQIASLCFKDYIIQQLMKVIASSVHIK